MMQGGHPCAYAYSTIVKVLREHTIRRLQIHLGRCWLPADTPTNMQYRQAVTGSSFGMKKGHFDAAYRNAI